MALVETSGSSWAWAALVSFAAGLSLGPSHNAPGPLEVPVCERIRGLQSSCPLVDPRLTAPAESCQPDTAPWRTFFQPLARCIDDHPGPSCQAMADCIALRGYQVQEPLDEASSGAIPHQEYVVPAVDVPGLNPAVCEGWRSCAYDRPRHHPNTVLDQLAR